MEHIVIIESIRNSFLCQNLENMRGINAIDNRTKISGNVSNSVSKIFNVSRKKY
jgi:hypothetical protein